MKKYNLSNIMKNAWAIRRSENVNMSTALKKAWADAKESKKMIGTEKQISWATEIRANVVKTFESVIADFAPMADSNEIIRKNISDVQARIDRLNIESVHAGDIIDLFKGIRFSGNHTQDFEKVIAVYRVTAPSTDGQRAILMR